MGTFKRNSFDNFTFWPTIYIFRIIYYTYDIFIMQAYLSSERNGVGPEKRWTSAPLSFIEQSVPATPPTPPFTPHVSTPFLVKQCIAALGPRFELDIMGLVLHPGAIYRMLAKGSFGWLWYFFYIFKDFYFDVYLIFLKFDCLFFPR